MLHMCFMLHPQWVYLFYFILAFCFHFWSIRKLNTAFFSCFAFQYLLKDILLRHLFSDLTLIVHVCHTDTIRLFHLLCFVCFDVVVVIKLRAKNIDVC